MSSPDKSADGPLHAGHPPAVKAGGMRIVQNKTHLKDKKADVPVPENHAEELKVSSSPPKQSELTVSGAKPEEKDAFPEQAVRAFHEKPLPTHDMKHVKQQIPIQQPRK